MNGGQARTDGADYTSVDLETTGLYPKYDRIIEIGAVRVRNGKPAAQYSSLVNPGRKLSECTKQLTGITDEQLEGAPGIEEVLPGFLEFVGKDVLLGHSLLFDFSFLKRAALNCGFTFEALGVDTLKLARKFLPELESRNLGFLCKHFGITHTAHRALGDAQAASRLYEILRASYYNEADFEPKPLIYKVKRESPASKAQKERIYRLAALHHVELAVDVEKLTRSEASRLADRILQKRGDSYIISI